MSLRKVSNHPVHLVDEERNLSPTALIPFCEFYGNMSVMGVKIDTFDVPVCNSFKPKLLGDQLCYEVDLNKYKDKADMNQKTILSLFIDYNEDRHLFLRSKDNEIETDSIIRIETIGTSQNSKHHFTTSFRSPETAFRIHLQFEFCQDCHCVRRFFNFG